MAKVLITHAVPVNNGDAALMKALHDALKAAGHSVKVATYYYSKVATYYPDIDFIREPSDYFLWKKLPFLKPFWIYLNYTLSPKFKRFDAYVACPGGYLNSYYHLKSAVKALEVKSSTKKTAIYAQSVGPLSKEDASYLNALGKKLSLLLTRDSKSVKTLEAIHYPGKFLKTKDAAFLLHVNPVRERKKGKVAISVREWKNDARDMEAYQTMIESMCLKLLQKGLSIEFLSTCQGVEGYRDDSVTAQEIAQGIVRKHPEYENAIVVNQTYYPLDQFLSHLENFELVIGTRLHMCILSLLKGIPAFNISYEFKGLECYKYLDISSYSADFNEPLKNALEKFEIFLAAINIEWPQIQQRITSVQKEVKADFDTFLTTLALDQ